MGTELLELLETAAIAVSGFLIKKYIFLEPDMEYKKQRSFYCNVIKINAYCIKLSIFNLKEHLIFVIIGF